MTRLETLLAAFGWQGGTIHQVAEATGCMGGDLLHAKPASMWHNDAYFTGNMNGWNAATWGTHRFLDPETGKAFPHTYGRLQYWLGVIDGFREARKEAARFAWWHKYSKDGGWKLVSGANYRKLRKRPPESANQHPPQEAA